jgi:hypothetical protein
MELTKEYFDQQIKNLISKEDAKTFATKDDLTSLATNAEMSALKEDVASLNSSLTTLRTDVAEMKATLTELNQRDLQDSNAFAKDLVQLQRDVKALKLKHA